MKERRLSISNIDNIVEDRKEKKKIGMGGEEMGEEKKWEKRSESFEANLSYISQQLRTTSTLIVIMLSRIMLLFLVQ